MAASHGGLRVEALDVSCDATDVVLGNRNSFPEQRRADRLGVR
jgi:hypothetical protein